MSSLEGPAAGWLLARLGPIGRRLNRRLTADHLPISGWSAWPAQHYSVFHLFAAAAPSDLPERLTPVDFSDRADEFVRQAYPGVFPEPEYVGPELVRFRAKVNDAPHTDHIITVHSTGLVELQWLLAMPPATELPLLDLVGVVEQLHTAVRGGGLTRLHRRRPLERWRRVDWRIGVNAWVTPTDGSGQYCWTEIGTAGPVPRRRTTDRRPHCPPTGFAAGQLSGVKRTRTLDSLIRPVLEELVTSGGYLGGEEIRRCVTELLAAGTLGDSATAGAAHLTETDEPT